MCVRVVKQNIELSVEPQGKLWRMFKVIYPSNYGFISGPFSNELLNYDVWHKAERQFTNKAYHAVQGGPAWSGEDEGWQHSKIFGFTGFPLRGSAERYLKGLRVIRGIVVPVEVQSPISVGFVREARLDSNTRYEVAWLVSGIRVTKDDVFKCQREASK